MIFRALSVHPIAIALFCFILDASWVEAANVSGGGDRSLSFKIAKDVSFDGTVEYYDSLIHTVTYWRDGGYDSKAFDEINTLLRDRVWDTTPKDGMDRRLLDLLFDLKIALEKRHPDRKIVFNVISGYRTADTNEELRNDPANPYRASVSKHSEHIRGQAIDVFVPGIRGDEMRDAAYCLKKGGVGWYPQFKGNFPYEYIHIDTGPVRHWGFDPKAVSCPS